MSQTPTNPNQPPYNQFPQGQPQGYQQYPQGQYPAQQRYDGPPQGYPQQGYQQPPMQPQTPPKKKRRGVLIAGIIVAVLLFGCIGVGVAASSHTGTTAVATTNQTTTSGSTQATQVPTKAPAQQKWTTTHTFTGNGTKKTSSFAIGNDWKITWTCKGVDIGGTTADAALTITVTGDNNTPVDVASSTCKAGKTTSDSTEEHTGGTVYLDILGDSDWTVNVQELK